MMTEKQRNSIFFLIIGYAGILLIGLGAMRFVGIFYDKPGYLLTFAGFLLITVFMRFMEKELELKKAKVLWVIKTVFMIVFLSLVFWLYT